MALSSQSAGQIPFEPLIDAALREFGVTGRVLVGVSGGADSVALLRGLVNLRERHSLQPVVAHLNHQLRGDDSAADAHFVRQLSATLKVPLVEGERDLLRLAAEQGIGIEEAARNARYEFLTSMAGEQRCPWVLLAHTADDQVETVLHHILRGTGLDGLCGIPPTRPLANGITIARPLLEIGRAAVEAYLRAFPQAWRDDQTNRNTSFTRNRIRHNLLPILREQYNPQVDAALVRLARQATEAQLVIDQFAEQLLSGCSLNRPEIAENAAHFDASILETAPVQLVREMLRRAWRRAGWPLGGMTFDHWKSLAAVARGQAAAIDLPGGIRAERRGSRLSLTRKKVPPRVETRSEPG